jgi:hypothetical protein
MISELCSITVDESTSNQWSMDILTFTLPKVTWDFPYMVALRSVAEEPVVPAFAPTPALL